MIERRRIIFFAALLLMAGCLQHKPKLPAPDIGVPTVFLSFGGYHHHLALTWFYSHVSTSRDAGQSGLNHFAIVYPDELSLARAVSEVLEHGELIDDARDHGATISVYLHDPDGNRIELYCDRPRCRWFDAWGQLIVDSEPFDLKQWLSDAIIRAAETSLQSTEVCHLGAFR